jgi:nicotinamide riboside transporter PnuC
LSSNDCHISIYIFLFLQFKIYSHVFTLFGPYPHPPASSQSLFCSLVLWFCWIENIGDNKKDVAFLLVRDKDSCTEWFLPLLPCTCVLQPTLVPLYQTSSQLASPLLIVASGY